MRYYIMAAVALLIATPHRIQAADLKLGTCDTSVGAWDFATDTGGRAVVAKDGAKYHVLWIARVANTTAGTTEAAGTASECSCSNSPTTLIWNCRIAFSLQPKEVGTQETYEWTVEGDNLRSRLVQPDGTRTGGVAFRRPR